MEPVGVIGGSGLYTLLDDARTVDVDTPYGAPSAAVAVGSMDGREVAFLPRHGLTHEFVPHRINYRANLWALRTLGVRQVLAPSAVGALDPGLAPGAFVVSDQLIDRTSGRERPFYDQPGAVVHVGFADPYCPRGRAAFLARGNELGLDPVDGGTLVVIDGPRFSTRAYGPGMPRHTPYAGVASLFRAAAECGDAPRLFEDDGQRRDFVHVRDVADAVAAAVRRPGPGGEVTPYNVGSGRVTTVGQLAAAIADRLGALAPVTTGEYRLGDVRHITASSERIAAGLGWRAVVPLETGLAELGEPAPAGLRQV